VDYWLSWSNGWYIVGINLMMDTLTGKHLVILGLARQGIALARFAASVGGHVTVSDLRPPERLGEALDALAGLNISFVLGEHPDSLLDGADILAISGGVPADAPLVQMARQQGIALTNDSLEFIRRATGRTIGITGSAGKTTTTSLVGEMCRADGRTTWVGGNIGQPLIAVLAEIGAGDCVVQELSSFQLEIWDRSPAIAAILNLTPNHLDRHKTMSDYIQAKGNIVRFQAADDVAVLCADDPETMALAPLVRGRMRLFSQQRRLVDGAFVDQGKVWLSENEDQTPLCSLANIGLRGRHNIYNVLAAATIADTCGISLDAMREAIAAFTGVPHRLEVVDSINQVQFINDSIATAPERALAAIDSFTEPIVLLAGGRDKEMKWDKWADTVNRRVRAVVLFGDLADELEGHLQQAAASLNGSRALKQIIRQKSLSDAVQAAAAIAQPGEVVLLAPGGTSFDAFTDFAERGQAFRELVKALAERAE
jgi:UDP-N-acetylmuramoylalanine--D-glutamate ligase